MEPDFSKLPLTRLCSEINHKICEAMDIWVCSLGYTGFTLFISPSGKTHSESYVGDLQKSHNISKNDVKEHPDHVNAVLSPHGAVLLKERDLRLVVLQLDRQCACSPGT